MTWKCVICLFIAISVVGATNPCPQRKDAVCPTLTNRKCRPALVKEAHCTRSDDCECPKVCCVTNECKRSCVPPKSLVQGRSSPETKKLSSILEKIAEAGKATEPVKPKDSDDEKKANSLGPPDSGKLDEEEEGEEEGEEEEAKGDGKEEEGAEEEEDAEASKDEVPQKEATDSDKKLPHTTAKTTIAPNGAHKSTADHSPKTTVFTSPPPVAGKMPVSGGIKAPPPQSGKIEKQERESGKLAVEDPGVAQLPTSEKHKDPPLNDATPHSGGNAAAHPTTRGTLHLTTVSPSKLSTIYPLNADDSEPELVNPRYTSKKPKKSGEKLVSTTAKPSTTSADKPEVKPGATTKPDDKPGATTKPGDKPGSTTKPDDKPGATTTDKPGITTTDKPEMPPAGKPTTAATDDLEDKPEGIPGATTTDKPGIQITDKPGISTTDKPGASTTSKPGASTTGNPEMTTPGGIAMKTTTRPVLKGQKGQRTVEPPPVTKKPHKTTRKPTPPPDDIIRNREVIVQLMSVLPKLLRNFYRGRTVPPLVVKLPSGEYIYVPPLPGYDSNKKNIGEAAKLFNSKKSVGRPWHKYMKNTSPFGEESPGPHLFPIFMTLTHPGDVFNRLPEQTVPAIEEFFFRMYPPIFKPKAESGFVLSGPLTEERRPESKHR